jgi:hypothetical protein
MVRNVWGLFGAWRAQTIEVPAAKYFELLTIPCGQNLPTVTPS